MWEEEDGNKTALDRVKDLVDWTGFLCRLLLQVELFDKIWLLLDGIAIIFITPGLLTLVLLSLSILFCPKAELYLAVWVDKKKR